MNDLIIGSTAIKYWFPDFKREPKDIDYISPVSLRTREKENLWIPEFKELLFRNKDSQYLDPELLLTLKSSHFGYNNQWEKHRDDILFLKRKGLSMDEELYKILSRGWKREFGTKWAKLGNKSAKDFFDDAVERKYIHDDIHEAVAIYDKPLYFQILESENSVKCLEEKFEKLSAEDKIWLVKEEVWVTSLERYLIPSNFTHSEKLGYAKSLKKLTTSMSSGWFKQFIISNFDKLYSCSDRRYIEKFKQAKQQNKLRLNND